MTLGIHTDEVYFLLESVVMASVWWTGGRIGACELVMISWRCLWNGSLVLGVCGQCGGDLTVYILCDTLICIVVLISFTNYPLSGAVLYRSKDQSRE